MASDDTIATHVTTAGRRGLSRRSGWPGLWLTLPPLAFLLALFAYPVARMLLLSVEDGSLTHYERAIFDGFYIQVFLDTFRIAAVVMLFAVVLGYPIAHFLATAKPPWATIGLVFVVLPFWTSLLVRTYAWMVLLGNDGVLNNLLLELNLISRPLKLMYNETGVLIGMIHVLMPYFVFPLYAVMCRIDRSLLAAAEGLGAPWWQVFLRIYLPLTLPGVMAGATLVFVLSLGFFITPALLGGGRVMMISVLIQQQVQQLLNWEFAAALCAILLVSALLVTGLVNRVATPRLR